jgi:hypothetical protein
VHAEDVVVDVAQVGLDPLRERGVDRAEERRADVALRADRAREPRRLLPPLEDPLHLLRLRPAVAGVLDPLHLVAQLVDELLEAVRHLVEDEVRERRGRREVPLGIASDPRLDALEPLDRLAQHRHDPVLREEDRDLARPLLRVGVGRVRDEEEVAVEDLELGRVAGRERVLERELVEAEPLDEHAALLDARAGHLDPDPLRLRGRLDRLRRLLDGELVGREPVDPEHAMRLVSGAGEGQAAIP